jgi:hypothetical protein
MDLEGVSYPSKSACFRPVRSGDTVITKKSQAVLLELLSLRFRGWQP